MNTLQMVDVGKLNEVLQYIKKDNENRKLLQGITNPSQLNLEEKSDDLEKKDKFQGQTGEKIAEFIKTKNTYKRKNPPQEEREARGEGNEEEEEEESEKKKIRATPQLTSERQIISFFKKKGFKTRNESIIIGGEKINEVDLIHDLSHNASKPSMYNLPVAKQNKVLIELKRKNMPAQYIRNNALRHKYTKIYKDGFSSSDSDHGGTSFTRIPQPDNNKAKWRASIRKK